MKQYKILGAGRSTSLPTTVTVMAKDEKEAKKLFAIKYPFMEFVKLLPLRMKVR